jgi:RNA polymerase sigma-70 factor (ECF subfamily)
MSAAGENAAEALWADAEIVARIAGGDRAAETHFVRKYQRGVSSLVRRHCRPNDPVVEDLVQDVLAAVLERLRAGAVTDAGALPAYIQAAIVRATSAEYRSRRTTVPSAVLEQVPSEECPTEHLSTRQLSELLATLLNQLPVLRDRELLARFYLDEDDKEEVCRRLDIDAAHFHRVVFRARERFRDLLLRAGIGSA